MMRWHPALGQKKMSPEPGRAYAVNSCAMQRKSESYNFRPTFTETTPYMSSDSGLLTQRLERLRLRLVESIPSVTVSARAHLRTRSLSDVLAIFMNWVDRRIPPRPREVYAWDGLGQRGFSFRQTEAINQIIDLFRHGGDLTPYLSRYWRTHGYEAPEATRRRSMQWQGKNGGYKDFALNTFDLHHLHLKPCDANGRHPGGSRELLYVHVLRERVTLVMLGDHNSFDDGTLLKAIAELRSQSGWDIKSGVGTSRSSRDSDCGFLLRNGVNSIIKAGDSWVLPGLVSSAGTSIEHRQWADHILEFLEEADEKFDQYAAQAPWANHYPNPGKDRINWAFSCGDFGLLNEEANLFWCLLPWKR